ncbi:MAG: GNAT family N-acetyltransferase [Actinomycetota bacterium]
MIDVRRLRHDEWRVLRQIRLEAIRDSPDAFFTPLAEAEAYPDTVWQDRARMAALGEGQVTAIATDGEMPVGMAVGLLRPDVTPDVVAVVSVYIAPPQRRFGIGAAVMSIVEEWASSRGASQTSLWVVETNDRARRFYESIGYRATTDRQKIPGRPHLKEMRLVKTIIASR